jgi:RNA polymerase sigma-54 factor
MDQGMSLEQRQTLHLTPQMRQSIAILQMNMIELNHWIEKELQDNPVLEIEPDEINEKDIKVSKEIDGESNLPKSDSDSRINWDEWEEKQSFFSYSLDQKGLVKNNTLAKEQEKDLQYSISQTTTLHEHLLLCLKLVVKNDIDFKIGEYLIDNINNNGYLGTTCLEVAQDLNITEKRVSRVLAMIQNCSMPGLGARNLKECLLLQLKHLKLEEKDILKNLIVFHLDELSKKNFKEICKKLNLSYYDIQQLLNILVKNFDPKPGRIFYQNSELNFLIPDIIVKKIGDKYEIIENKGYLPSIKINTLYKNMLIENKLAGDAKNRESFYVEKENEHQKTLRYLEKKIKSASWVIRCIEQRKKTIFDVTQFIIDYQRQFLEKGVAYLRPLSMKNVADSLGLHESTVSRAISEKKIQLPRGIYNMKFFFSKALPQKREEAVSNERIKNLVKKYILMEDPYHPYSDQKMTELLQTKENIKVARRTITKYREMLKISHSKIRRKYKKQENIQK